MAPALPDMLVDQGDADNFCTNSSRPTCWPMPAPQAGIPATIRMQPGYDHSYYFISSFMADHVALARRAPERLRV
jgi:S-formylglutathione hydrolase